MAKTTFGDFVTSLILEAEISHSIGKNQFQFSYRMKEAATAVKGPSGCGKTTFLKILAGLDPRAKGRIKFKSETWLDSETNTFVPPWERQVGWVPQDALCFPHLSVRENLGFSGRSNESELEELAGTLGIRGLLDRRVRNLSGGERHRVSLGRALLSKPKLLLLDEPFSSLDKPLRQKLITFVREFSKSHFIPLLLVTHDEELTLEDLYLIQGKNQSNLCLATGATPVPEW